MRKAWITFALLALPLAAGAGPLPDYPFAYADGQAQRELAPDVVTVSFGISAQRPTSEAAIASVQETARQAFAILAKAGAKPAQIEATQISKQRMSHWDDKTQKTVLDGYEVSRSVSVTLHDLEAYPAALLQLMALAGTQGFNSGFDRSDRKAIESELAAAATEDARAHAARLAVAAQRKLGPARAISEAAFGELPGRFGFGGGGGGGGVPMAMARMAPAPTDAQMVPASITLSAAVHVVFELQ